MKIRSTSNVEYHIVVKMSTAVEPGQPGNGLFLWIHFLRCCGRFCENSKSWRLNKCWVKLATSLKTNPKRTSPGCYHKIYEMLQNYQCPPPLSKAAKNHSLWSAMASLTLLVESKPYWRAHVARNWPKYIPLVY